MNYTETIKTINPILENNEFRIVESRKNYTKYQSEIITIIIAFNEHENGYTIFAGRNGGDLVELSKKVYKEFFDFDFYAVENLSFSQRFIRFLNGKGNAILKGDLKKLAEFETYHQEESKKYTENLINLQNLKIADKAWVDKKYSDFIKYINLINSNYLPESYGLKIKIALRKLEEEKAL